MSMSCLKGAFSLIAYPYHEGCIPSFEKCTSVSPIKYFIYNHGYQNTIWISNVNMYRVTELNVTRIWIELAVCAAMVSTAQLSLSGSPGTHMYLTKSSWRFQHPALLGRLLECLSHEWGISISILIHLSHIALESCDCALVLASSFCCKLPTRGSETTNFI